MVKQKERVSKASPLFRYNHMHMNFRIFLFSLFLSLPLMALPQAEKTLEFEDLIFLIRSNHPIAQQIDLLSDQAKAQLRKARGGFDPKLYGSYDDKEFDAKNYWRVFEGGLKIPTGLPVELKTGYTWNDGTFLNPGQTLPNQGQAVLGGTVTLGKGLFIDERRAALKQARIFTQLAETEQVRMLNDLFWHAAQQYWQWSAAYGKVQVLNQSLTTAERRFRAVKATFLAGDYAGIDTTEALTQLQNLQLLRNEALIEWQTSAFELSNFLWNDLSEPLEITNQLVPVLLTQMALPDPVTTDSLRSALMQTDLHPEIRKFDFKRSELQVERRLKSEKLKPTVDLEYNFLSPTQAFNGEEVGIGQWQWGQNYKWGVKVGFPIFLRKERGDLALTKIKLQENDLKQQQKQQTIINKMLAYANELEILQSQVSLYTNAVANYDRLLRGEETKFDAGESTLFLINSREMKLLDAQIKLLMLRSKLFKAEAGLRWASGNLGR